MTYSILLFERDFVGRRIPSPLDDERFESLALASQAAQEEAFHLSTVLGVPVALAIADTQRTLVRHIVPPWHVAGHRPSLPMGLR